MLGTRLPLALTVALLAAAASPSRAQVVSLRTVPLPRWQQFDRLPSSTMAMGGVRIALDDSLADPFLNPAKGIRLQGVRLFASPSRYHTTIDPETGSSLPIGLTARVGPWFGAAAFSWQNVKLTQRFLPSTCPGCNLMGDPRIPPPNPTNQSGQLAIGRRFAGAGLAVGASVGRQTLGWAQGLQSLLRHRREDRARRIDDGLPDRSHQGAGRRTHAHRTPPSRTIRGNPRRAVPRSGR